MSCITLLHSAVQLLLHDHPQHVWKTELSHAKSCLDVLVYCGIVDKIAQHFAEGVQGHYDKLAAEAEQDSDLPDADVDMPGTFDYLFTVPDSSPDHLKAISRNLLTLVSRPFGFPADLYTEGTLNAGIGAHPNWSSFLSLPFNNTNANTSADAVDDLPVLGMPPLGMTSGRFVGSSHPHGWEPRVNLKNL